MAQFPKLKTGAVAQHPAVRELLYSTEIKTFLDSSEQRYRNFPAPKRRWMIALNLLDETETSALMNFFEQQQGRLGVFEFEDPWTGTLVEQCRFGEDQFPVVESSESRCALQLTIEEVQSE
jgi:hypothetical protein